MLKKILLLSVTVFFSLSIQQAAAQAGGITPHDLERMQIMEDSMLVTIDSMYNAYLPDTHVGYSERLIKQLVKTLKYPNSYQYPFDKLKEKINIISPDDNSFRIFNWSADVSQMFRRYYGAIQMPGENLKLYGLIDYNEQLGKGAEDSVLTGGKWYGALYYRILATEVDGQKIYTLFGLNEGPVSNKKILDPLTFVNGTITFGAPIFGIGSKNFPRQPIRRFIMEYKKEVHTSLNWDPEKNAIVFDDLVSQVNDPNRKYTFVPSGQYNAFIWANNMWNLRMNIVPITELQDGQAPTEDDKDKQTQDGQQR